MSYRRTRFREKMDKSSNVVGKCRSHLWCFIISSISLWLLLFYLHSSSLVSSKDVVQSLQKEYSIAVPNHSSENGEETITGNEYYIAVPSHSTQNRDESVLGDGMNMQVQEHKMKNSVTGDEIKPSKNEIITSEAQQEPSEGARSKPSSGDQEEGTSDQVELGTEEAERVEPVKGIRSRPSSVNRKPEVENPRSKPKSDDCSGKYIYIQPLPRRFNEDLLKDCRKINMWIDMCRYITTMGLGPPIGSSRGVFSNTGWYATNQFVLDILIHNRMKRYKCLTSNSSMASAIFVPFYAGFDVSRHLWGYNTSVRDANSLSLIKWLTATPEWKVLGGRDHFLVAGRITWDFRRLTDDDSDWGNKLMLLNESRNMTILTIESSPWNNNDFAIPYPTYFHPSRDVEVFQWQNRMRRIRKRYLFSFAGGSRPNLTASIRSQIMDQCQASRRKCKMLECISKSNKCENPSIVMKLFQSSVFCLQPPGDSYTRRSAFDSILAGCIPVFFHPGSAYVQYLWHLPKNYTSYSVLISEDEIRKGKANIERRLSRIPREQVRAMREQVIRLIPRVIYADPRSRLETVEDAFDLTIQGVFRRVDRARKANRDGVDPDAGYREANSWKYNFFGTEVATEWDPFFHTPKKSVSY